jgi:hypothetical protein
MPVANWGDILAFSRAPKRDASRRGGRRGLGSERVSDRRSRLRSRDHLTNVSLFTHGLGRDKNVHTGGATGSGCEEQDESDW